MKAITTHGLTDFDGLAAMALAKKLNPDFRVFLPQRLSKAVQDFLAIYKDEFDFLEEFPGDEEKITELILVDTQKNPFPQDSDFRLIIYDHHPPFELTEGVDGEVKKVGSTTAILLGKIIEKGMELTEPEKVLAAIAIYSDTVSFTADYTSLEDFRAALYLWEKGFNISILREFLHLPLNEKQQDLLNQLLDEGEIWKIKGLSIHIFRHKQKDYMTGLNQIAQTLIDIRDADAVFLILENKNRQFVVGRAIVPEINLGPIMERLGGGGHRGAGSALAKDIDGNTLVKMLRDYLEESIVTEQTARDIMSSPVKTVTPDTPVEKAEELMEFYGHNGLIIVGEKGIEGIFSRRDLIKVKKHGLSHAPVKGYMSRRVLTIGPDTSIPEIQEIMIKNNVGRLPVLDAENNLLGIVTRSDLLKVHHKEQLEVNRYGGQLVLPELKTYNVRERLANLPPRLEEVFGEISECSSQIGVKVYVVGGFVRDLLLGRINFNLDFIVEEEGVLLARQLARRLGGKLTQFEDFNTATLELEDGLAMDIAQTRREYYEYPAALPQVEPASLKQDLYRRDYTVNSMVISLSGDEWGQLLDLFGGYQDLKKKRLQVLHTMSFVDDPQRIFRGISLILRYNFSFSTETRSLMEETIQADIFQNLPALVIKDNIRRLLDLGDWGRLGELFEEFKIWPALLPFFPQGIETEKEALGFLEKTYKKDEIKRFDPLLLFTGYICRNEPVPDRDELVERWQLDKKAKRLFTVEIDLIESTLEKIRNMDKPAEVFQLLSKYTRDFSAILGALDREEKLQRKITDFLFRSSFEEVELSGQELLKMGFPRGPELGKALQEIRAARINGEVSSLDQEKELARRILAAQGGKNRDD